MYSESQIDILISVDYELKNETGKYFATFKISTWKAHEFLNFEEQEGHCHSRHI